MRKIIHGTCTCSTLPARQDAYNMRSEIQTLCEQVKDLEKVIGRSSTKLEDALKLIRTLAHNPGVIVTGPIDDMSWKPGPEFSTQQEAYPRGR